MTNTHSKIIAAAAKAELAPLDFRRKGQSRLWLADRGSWLNVVEFTPSAWSKSVSLMNGAHWLWSGTGFLSFDEAMPSNCRAHFETDEQFTIEVAKIAELARERALEIEERFASFDAIADFVIQSARKSPDRMAPSWWGYKAGIASGLIGRMEDARAFLHGLTDERVTKHAAPLLPLIDQPEAFKSKVNDFVAQQRATLKLEALSTHPF